ncbi:hypothetical protein SAMN05421809_1570 [Natronorubrum daqingense]|uniref:Uncharacterized protein n=1 Tax=Natronorubrum daqingense TaxID=588898 RepID=A0A1N7C8C5_9EURY|nr:hypothetical protein SAMN05421809_1570 [Natronorubrum daqingense]
MSVPCSCIILIAPSHRPYTLAGLVDGRNLEAQKNPVGDGNPEAQKNPFCSGYSSAIRLPPGGMKC